MKLRYFHCVYHLTNVFHSAHIQVMASKTKIYIILEYVDGGELFDKIVSNYSNASPHIAWIKDLCSTSIIACNQGNPHLLTGLMIDSQAKHGRLREDEARRYFQQLIDAVDYCHSRGVYHRDLKVHEILLFS